MRAAFGWAAFWAGFAALDVIADRRGCSLSETTRQTFRTDTPAGAVAFSAALGAGAAVLHRHILKVV